MSMTNPQWANVGNAGDRLKHCGLIMGVHATAITAGSPIGFIDTHAFAWRAPCANPDEWRTAMQSTTSNSYTYLQYQAGMQEGNSYACSPALADQAMRGFSASFMWLGETDPRQREQLIRDTRGISYPLDIVSDGRELLRRDLPKTMVGVSVHLDPFTDLDSWMVDAIAAVERWIDGKQCHFVHLQCYAHRRQEPWPRQLGAYARLIGHAQDGPHGVAAYLAYHVSITNFFYLFYNTVGWTIDQENEDNE